MPTNPTADYWTSLEKRNAELQRRLTEILELIDGREDIEDGIHCQYPNIFMRIGMCARGEDRP